MDALKIVSMAQPLPAGIDVAFPVPLSEHLAHGACPRKASIDARPSHQNQDGGRGRAGDACQVNLGPLPAGQFRTHAEKPPGRLRSPRCSPQHP